MTEPKCPCPECGGKTKVVNSRGPLRWRECLACRQRWLTEEQFKSKVRRYTKRKAA